MEENVVVEQKYSDYIDTLIEQMKPLLPEDVNKLQQDYLVSNIKKSTFFMILYKKEGIK